MSKHDIKYLESAINNLESLKGKLYNIDSDYYDCIPYAEKASYDVSAYFYGEFVELLMSSNDDEFIAANECSNEYFNLYRDVVEGFSSIETLDVYISDLKTLIY